MSIFGTKLGVEGAFVPRMQESSVIARSLYTELERKGRGETLRIRCIFCHESYQIQIYQDER
jgi:hypothetical protein